MSEAAFLPEFIGFDWTGGNAAKNWEKHHVAPDECEQVFFNSPLLAGDDPAHSQREERYYVLGQTDKGRKLFVVFTMRDSRIRVISARDMTRKERRVYWIL